MVETIQDLLARAGEATTAGTSWSGLRFVDRRERETELSWPEILQRATDVAGRLQAVGLGKGERVGLIYPTGPAFFDAFFGVLLAGAVPVPLYPPVRLGRLEEYHRRTAAMLEAAGTRLLLTDPRIRRILGETVEAARLPLGVRALSELPAGPFGAPGCGPEDLALVQFSSGTTVEPKPVALTHQALLAQATCLNTFWPDQGELLHSGVSWLPLYHDMGLIGCVLPALERPGTLTLLGPELFVARPSLWLRALSRSRATISPAPNFAYGLCVSKIQDEELEGVDLSDWRVALNGAEPVSPDVLRAFQDRFARWGFRAEALTPVYGLSEASLAVTFSELGEPFVSRRYDRDRLSRDGVAELNSAGVEIASVGRPLPGFEVEIRDPERLPVAAGKIGRVWVRGPSLMTGYLGRREATAEVLVDGWLDTGDLGFLDQGELFLTGRHKDLIILRGRNYAPHEIEMSVDPVPGVRTGCVIATSWMPEGAETECLVLFAEHRKGIDPATLSSLPDRIRAAVLGATGLAVDEVVVLEPGALPRTSSGKLRRGEARRLYLGDGIVAPKPVNPVRLAGAFARSGAAYVRNRLNRKDR